MIRRHKGSLERRQLRCLLQSEMTALWVLASIPDDFTAQTASACVSVSYDFTVQDDFTVQKVLVSVSVRDDFTVHTASVSASVGDGLTAQTLRFVSESVPILGV